MTHRDPSSVDERRLAIHREMHCPAERLGFSKRQCDEVAPALAAKELLSNTARGHVSPCADRMELWWQPGVRARLPARAPPS